MWKKNRAKSIDKSLQLVSEISNLCGGVEKLGSLLRHLRTKINLSKTDRIVLDRHQSKLFCARFHVTWHLQRGSSQESMLMTKLRQLNQPPSRLQCGVLEASQNRPRAPPSLQAAVSAAWTNGCFLRSGCFGGTKVQPHIQPR